MTRVFLLYLAVGLLCVWVCDRKQVNRAAAARLGSAALSLVAWPLWVPLTLLGAGDAPVESTPTRRVRAALEEARAAVVGTPLSILLPEDLVSRWYGGLAHVERRHAELSRLLARPEFRAQGNGAQAEHVRRLHTLERRDGQLLDEMAELAEALRTQLLVARFSGRDSEGDGARGLVSDLSTRVESMDAWFELDA